MKQYFAAYKHDLKTLKEIWDKTPKMFDDWFFNDFTTRYKNICWTITNNKITGYCNEEFYKDNYYQEINLRFDMLTKENNLIIKASDARKMLNERFDNEIEITLKNINSSIEEAIRRLENSIKIDFDNKFCNIVDILEEAGYILTKKKGQYSIILEISW